MYSKIRGHKSHIGRVMVYFIKDRLDVPLYV